MANGLKYGLKDLTALQFDAPVVEMKDHSSCIRIRCANYDFSTDWIINPEQPQGGIVINEDTIEINSFKPNTWIIKSTYSDTTTEASFLSKFYGVLWELSLLTEHNSYLSYVTSYGSYRPIGVVLSPISNSNTLLTLAGGLDWPINQGCLKDVVGWQNYGFISNGRKSLYICSDYYLNNGGTPSSLYNGSYPQMALTIFTANETAQDGTITIIDTKAIVNPTNIEGYKAYVGRDQVYDKPMTFQNVLMRHDCAFKETGNFTETVDGKTVVITSHYGSEQNTAFVISMREYDNLYQHMRLPAIIDLGTLIQQSFPFKFWAKLERDSTYTHIWDSLVAAFNNNAITDDTFANHLFSNSSGDINSLNINFDVGLDSGGQDSRIIDMMGMFDCSNLANHINFNITTGKIVSLVNVFKQTRTLQSVTFNKTINVSDWQGSFEGTRLVDFPTNIAALNRWHESTTLSGPECAISDCADGSSLTHFGNWMADPGQDGVIPASTFTPVTPGTSSNVGTVIISGTVDSTKEYTLKANVCPGVMVPSFDGETYNIRRLRPNYLSDGIVFIIQGIGYDSSSNKIAATPSYIIDAHATSPQFNANTLFTEINYVPDSLNTSYVGISSSDVYSDGFSSKYYRRCSDFGSWQPGYVEMSLTATGLQRMQIEMTVINVDSTITASSYTVNSHSAPHVFTYDTSYSVTAWGIEGFAYAMLEQEHLVVSPYCRNAFYNSAITEVRYLLDMKYVEPLYGMICGDEWNRDRYTIFGNGLETAYISNLNKGNWSLDGTSRPDADNNNICGGNLSNFSAECANYLVANLFDLRRNTTEADRLENEINSFNGWTVASGSNGWKRPIVFYASGNATMSRSVTASGVLKLNAAFSGCTVAVKRGLSTTQLAQGSNEINVYNGDTVQIIVTATGANPTATVELAEPFLSELTESLSTANIYLPSSWSSLLNADVVHSANDKGWVLYVGGNEYSV